MAKAKPYKDIEEFVEVKSDGHDDWLDPQTIDDDDEDEYDCEETFDEVFDQMFPDMKED